MDSKQNGRPCRRLGIHQATTSLVSMIIFVALTVSAEVETQESPLTSKMRSLMLVSSHSHPASKSLTKRLISPSNMAKNYQTLPNEIQPKQPPTQFTYITARHTGENDVTPVRPMTTTHKTMIPHIGPTTMESVDPNSSPLQELMETVTHNRNLLASPLTPPSAMPSISTPPTFMPSISTPPSSMPSTDESTNASQLTTVRSPSEQDQFLSIFASAIGNNLVHQRDTPHRLAAEWIIQSDPMQLPIDSDHLIQRFVLVLFYYQTSNNGTSPWKSCNPPTMDENATCVFFEPDDLVANGAPVLEAPYYRWLSEEHECEWAGVVCDRNPRVRAIQLFGQGLSGTLPTEIMILSGLQSFSVPFNSIEGTIPSAYVGLRRLLQIELHYNLLSGTFSNQWYRSTNLLNLNLGGNLISGRLRPRLGKLSNLKGLHLFENVLTGTIPTSIGKLSVLAFSRLNSNGFQGTLATELGRLELLEEFWLYGNQLMGNIPSQLGLLTSMLDLRLNDNSLSGDIPEELYNMTNLTTELELSDMNLTGTLSTKIGLLSNLQILRLRRNQLTGTIPTELALLTTLQLAWLHLNNFQGSVPTLVCANRGLAEDGKLQFLQADCGPRCRPAQMCECCTACCDRTTSVCVSVK